MALAKADRVRETSVTTGTGSYTLAGAVSGFQTFALGVGNGNTCYYAAVMGTSWEVGVGTLSGGTTLSRDTILASSTAGSPQNERISWAAGTKDIFLTVPASKLPQLTAAGDYVLPSASGLGMRVDPADPSFGWRDIIGAVQPKASGVGSPARAIYNGGNIGDYSFVANDLCDFVFHIPHDYVPGTDVYFHVHWSHNGTSISGNAVFDIYHMYAKGHNQANFPAEKNVTIIYDTVDIATTPQYRHRIDEVIISGASATATLMDRDDIEVDGLIIATLKMTTLPTIGGGGELFIHTCDIHYQSSNEPTKNKAPSFYA